MTIQWRRVNISFVDRMVSLVRWRIIHSLNRYWWRLVWLSDWRRLSESTLSVANHLSIINNILRLPHFHGFNSQHGLQFLIAKGVGRDVWISLENFQGVLESRQNFAQNFSSLSDSFWFAQSSLQLFILINLIIKLHLQSVLGFSDKEISNCFWD